MKTGRFELRATKNQLVRWRVSAKADGRTLANWLTHVANMAATRMELRADYAAEQELER